MGEHYKKFSSYQKTFAQDLPNYYVEENQPQVVSSVMAGLERKLKALEQKRFEKKQLELELRQKDAEIFALQHNFPEMNSSSGVYGKY